MLNLFNTQVLNADQVSIAAAILQDGGIVAMPTETVYGLAADASNSSAVARIYEAKKRPSFNPLIIHVSDIAMAQQYVKWSDAAAALAKAFWPGALTMVLPLRHDARISPLVTAGLDTIAVRIPAHPLAQNLIRAVDRPLAAPSANPSGRISSTTVDHVISGLFGRISAVLDGGPCSVGVESTIIAPVPEPTLLRAGGIMPSDIEAVIGTCLQRHSGSINAPGQMTSHYAPNAPMRLNAETAQHGETMLGFGEIDGALNLSPSGDLTEAAANLFAFMHQLDDMDVDRISVAPIPETGIGLAINDRLRRAAAPRD